MVYLMECVRSYDTVYKIGYSKHPPQRMDEVKTGNDGIMKILYTFSGEHERKIERALQRFYSHNNTRREWFSLDIKEVVNFLPLCKKTEENIKLIHNFNI